MGPNIPRQGGGSLLTPYFDRGLKKKAKKFLGPFFQKFDGFSKNFKNLTVFSGFNGFHSAAQAKNLGTPFFGCQRSTKNFHFRPRTPQKNLVTTYGVQIPNTLEKLEDHKSYTCILFILIHLTLTLKYLF